MIKAKVCYTIDVSMYGFAEKQLHIEQNTDFVMGGVMEWGKDWPTTAGA